MSPERHNSHPDRWHLLNELTDEQLVEALSSGEQDGLAVLFDRYHKLVFRVAVRIVNDPGEAEEVVQTVFLDFFRARASFDARKGTLKVWLLQYAYHRALNRRRHLAASRFYRWVDLDTAILQPELSWDPGAVTEMALLMEQLIVSLTPRRRRILELTYFEGLTAEEIAVELQQSVNVVRHELYRSLAKLRRAMAAAGTAAAEKETASSCMSALKSCAPSRPPAK